MKTVWTMTRLALGAATLGLGSGGTAQAVPYGFSTNQISDFALLANGGTVTFSGGSQSTDNSATLTPGNSVSTTAPVIVPNASDAGQATVGAGPFPDEGTYSPTDLSSGSGARADSDTSAGDPVNGGIGSINNVAETRNLSGVASGSGKNTAALTVGVTAGAQLEFQFSNDLLLIASTDNVGETAGASVQNDFRILDGSGAVVFDFAPSGLGQRTVQGGSVLSDPFSLNQTASSADGGDVATVSNGLDTDFFDAISDPLAAGNYTILISTLSSDSTSSSSATPAPEPASLLLLGVGLMVLGVLRRTTRSSPGKE